MRGNTSPLLRVVAKNSNMKNATIAIIAGVFIAAFIAGVFAQQQFGIAAPKTVVVGTPHDKLKQYMEDSYRIGYSTGAGMALQGHFAAQDTTYERWLNHHTEEFMAPLK